VQKEIKGDKFWKLSMAVEIGDEHFIFDMSKRDSVEISKEYGENLENWSGKELIFSVIPTALGDSVYAKAVKSVYTPNKGAFRLKESV
jgi:hypothetical protein